MEQNIPEQWTEQPLHDRYSNMMDALRYVVQSTKELDFFGSEMYGTEARAGSVSYSEDWRGVWA